MPAPSALADRVSDYLTSRRIAFEAKPMMGGICFMVDGKMCVGAKRERLMARLDPASHDEFVARPGCRPMDHGGRTMTGFYFIDAEGHDRDADLRFWLDLALAFNPHAQASAKSRATRKRSA